MSSETLFVPFLQTEVDWAIEHRWQAGDSVDSKVYGHAFWLVVAGDLLMNCQNEEFALAAGAACFVPGGLARGIAAGDAGAVWLSVGLRTNLFGRDNLFQQVKSPVVWKPPTADRALMTDWMRRICAEREPIPFSSNETQRPQAELHGAPTQPRAPASALIGDGLGRALLGLCWEALGGGKHLHELRQTTPAWLSQTLAHAQSHPQTTVHELAHVACLSPSQFRRAFHQWVGISPQKYVMRCRLDEARRLLATTDWVVNAIAERVGFQSLSHFTVLFRDHFGVTPARYRHSLQSPSEDTARY